MKTTKTLAKQAALIAALVLSSSTWLSAQTNKGQIIRTLPDGVVVREQDTYRATGTNSQPNQGRIGQPAGGMGQSAQLMKINKGSSLIGTTVKNQQGETLGKITDLVIDFNSDRVAYVVLDSETGLLSSAKLHAVPLRAFQPGSDGTSLILNADKNRLAQSEGFDKNNWPASTTATWGAEPFWSDDQGTSGTREGLYLEQPKTKESQPQPQPVP